VVNQDTLGSRAACEAAAERALRAGQHVVVDRCNVDVPQRRVWVLLARAAGARAAALHLSLPARQCEARASARKGHATLAPSDAGRVIAGMAADFSPPRTKEGFACVQEAPNASAGAAALEGAVQWALRLARA
jgi:predicted kinase